MSKLLLTAAAAAMVAGGAAAQTAIKQASSEWFTSAQAELAKRLNQQPNTRRAKNVILFTADGNGVGTNYALRLFAGQQAGKLGDEHVLPYEQFPYLALAKTYNTNAQTPDSAPTASAMNSGVKSKFTTIGVDETVVAEDCSTYGPEHELTLMSDIATDLGKSVGAISTTRITHATPAAVYVHTVNRDWEGSVPEGCAQKDVADQMMDAMKDGRLDVAMGGGRRFFLPEGVVGAENTKGRRTDGRNLIEEAQAAGMQVAQDDAEFAALNLDGSTPILGLFEDSHMKYEHDRTGEPSLAEMTAAAIRQMSNNENGFYLMVEAGRVDHANHDGNLFRTLTDGVAFVDAVAMADAMTNDLDTLIIVTADHEHAIAFNGYCGRGTDITGLCMGIDDAGVKHTGKPVLAADGKPYTVAGYLNGVGSVLKQEGNDWVGARPDLTQEQATDPDYIQQALIPLTSETHSGEDVAIYAKGPWAHLFEGTVEQNYIFHVMDFAVSAGQ
jgi:alkaline phosphatase